MIIKAFTNNTTNKSLFLHKITVYTSNCDSTSLISIVTLFFMSKNRKSHGVACVFISLFILLEIVMLRPDKIIFNNKMHEIDDVGTN